MMVHMSVLAIETLKLSLLTKETEVSKQERVVFLVENAKHVSQWIQGFNPNVVTVDKRIPPDLFRSEKAFDKIMQSLP